MITVIKLFNRIGALKFAQNVCGEISNSIEETSPQLLSTEFVKFLKTVLVKGTCE